MNLAEKIKDLGLEGLDKSCLPKSELVDLLATEIARRAPLPPGGGACARAASPTLSAG